MSEVTLDTIAYSKIMLHAAKYPYCAVNGVLLADNSKLKDGAKDQNLDIVDSVPLFHHSHYLTPMAEIALTQIETVVQEDKKVIAGYYAGCENFKDNSVEKCPGQKIAEKIVENFPSAIFIVVDNQKLMQHLDIPAIKMYKFTDGKWKPKDANLVLFQSLYVLEAVSRLLQDGIHKKLVDFDNYLDDISLDWSNQQLNKEIAMIASDADEEGEH